MFLEEIAPEVTLEELRGITSAKFEVSSELKTYPVPPSAE